MPKRLFELIVIEGQMKGQAQATRADLRSTFEKKRHLFEEKRKTFVPVEEGAPPVVEEQSDIQTNVMSELRWLAGLWTKAMDVSFQVAHGNTNARDNVVLDDGTILLENVPATALLEMEKRVAEIQEVFAAAPTLDPAKSFRPDPDRGRLVFRARDVVKTRTRKVQRPLVLFPATPEHPAQTQLISVDEPAGQITEQEWSGLITPAHKSQLIERAEELRRAVKAALHRANTSFILDDVTCGKKVFDYLLGQPE